jgi:hypothetical protein
MIQNSETAKQNGKQLRDTAANLRAELNKIDVLINITAAGNLYRSLIYFHRPMLLLKNFVPVAYQDTVDHLVTGTIDEGTMENCELIIGLIFDSLAHSNVISASYLTKRLKVSLKLLTDDLEKLAETLETGKPK